MAKVKLDFAKKTVPAKIEFVGAIVKKMTGNPNFPAPDPTLASVEAAAEALSDAYADSLDGGKTKTALKNQKEKELNVLMSKLAAYVQYASGGDENKIASSGMGVQSKATPTSAIDTPEGLLANIGGSSKIDLTWDPVEKAKSYDVQINPDPNQEASWTHLDITTESKYTASGLEKGKTYWFRVAAIGPKGLKSDWSDPAGSLAG